MYIFFLNPFLNVYFCGFKIIFLRLAHRALLKTKVYLFEDKSAACERFY